MNLVIYPRLRILLLLVVISFTYVLKAAVIVPSPPKINASSYLVMDFQSNEMIVSENIDERVEPASLTKMMTVYVAANELVNGNIKYDDLVTISEKAWRMEGSRMFIEVNKQVSVEDLLKGIIIQSGNDASVAIAEYIAGSEEVFAQVMNQYAARLGMSGTNFINSTGLPHEDHYTTAHDMAILAAALIRDFPEEYALHSIKEFTYGGIKQHNRNRMLWRDDSVDGIKTGHTQSAGYCLVASAVKDNMRLISVVMGTDSEEARERASQSIMNYAFRFFQTYQMYDANEVIASNKIWKGEKEIIDLGLREKLYLTIPRGAYDKLDAAIELESTIVAPVNEGDIKGTLRIVLDGEELASRPLIVLNSVSEGSFFSRMKDDILLLFE